MWKFFLQLFMLMTRLQLCQGENSHFRNKVASVEGALAVLQAARDSTSLAWCTLRDPWILGHKGNLLQYATVKILY